MGFLQTNLQEVRYNEPFRVVGVQMVDIDNQILGAWRLELPDEKGRPKIYKGVKNFYQWTRAKQEISDLYVDYVKGNNFRKPPKDVVRFIIKFLFGGSEIVTR